MIGKNQTHSNSSEDLKNYSKALRHYRLSVSSFLERFFWAKEIPAPAWKRSLLPERHSICRSPDQIFYS
jgi:hypothetical protein